ncbi:MAG: hypothetical protein CO066_04215 [Comamonadaceae bacterium CG_4_9_14_0_8_um_filter_60_18]|nr:MAG: hypothetical protein CO066_04215 [Comamonadaceae bacterium CG_4_9_14_0_8_um_filter_60_18]
MILVVGDSTFGRINPMPFPDLYIAANTDFAVARYSSDGSLDKSFGVNGKTNTDFGFLSDTGYAVTLQSDGAILVSGSSQIYIGPDVEIRFSTVRYTSDGSLDPTFKSR